MGSKDDRNVNDGKAGGYGKPPAASRFKKGQSGNPGGRPPKSVSQREVVEKVLAEEQRLAGQPSGARVRYTALELVIVAVKQLAAGGHRRASKLYTDVLDEYGTQEPITPERGYLVVPERLTMEEWEARYSPKDPPPDPPPSDEEMPD